MKALYKTQCEDCGCIIAKGEHIYFDDSSKLCQDCARDAGIVCQQCRGQKKSEYETCFDCKG